MKLIATITFVSLLITISQAYPRRKTKTYPEILEQKFKVYKGRKDNYNFFYRTSDAILRKETGEIINPNSENPVLLVRGIYSYIGDDGLRYEVNYVADDKGFRPELNVKFVSSNYDNVTTTPQGTTTNEISSKSSTAA